MRRRRLERLVSVDDVRREARRVLPRMVFDFVDGGAEDEATVAANRSAFSDLELVPRVLVDVSERDQSTTVCGQHLATPIILAPTGMPGLTSSEGELGAARAAAAFGTVLTVSSASTYSIEDVAAAAPGDLWFQLYPWRDRDLMGVLIDRARLAGYRVLCVTVDVPVTGARERDVRNGMTLPPRITARNAVDVLRRGRWVRQFVRAPRVTLTNLEGLDGAPGSGAMTLVAWSLALMNPSHDWSTLAWIRERWPGALMVKGILSGEDAVRAVDAGADGIVVSNHGGRQLDGAIATLRALPNVVDAVGGRADVVLDGGVRRGADVAKALALGASACMVGRPYLYGLAAGGQAGVERVLSILTTELDRTLALLGRPSVRELDRSAVHVPPIGASQPTPWP